MFQSGKREKKREREGARERESTKMEDGKSAVCKRYNSTKKQQVPLTSLRSPLHSQREGIFPHLSWHRYSRQTEGENNTKSFISTSWHFLKHIRLEIERYFIFIHFFLLGGFFSTQKEREKANLYATDTLVSLPGLQTVRDHILSCINRYLGCPAFVRKL